MYPTVVFLLPAYNPDRPVCFADCTDSFTFCNLPYTAGDVVPTGTLHRNSFLVFEGYNVAPAPEVFTNIYSWEPFFYNLS